MDFPSLLSNSALMQSYNLMKMSSEVTKTPVYYAPQDRPADFQKQTVDFNRNMPPQQKPAAAQPDKMQMDPYLGRSAPGRSSPCDLSGFKPSELGIPHGAGLGAKPTQKKPSLDDMPIRPQKSMQSDFQSFDETFKPMNKLETFNSSGKKPFAKQELREPDDVSVKKADDFDADFDDQPIPTAQKARDEAPPLDPNVLDVDAIEIKPKQQLTFEELLEKELQDKAVKQSELPPDDDRVIRKKPK